MMRWQNTVEEAYQRLQAATLPPHRTALELNTYFTELSGVSIYLKQEHMQRTGSFKYRGALNKLLSLSPQQLKNGIIAASSGNHGIACALAAQQLNSPLTIYTPATASDAKLDVIRRLGGCIETVNGDSLQAELKARQTADTQRKVFVSPYNDIDVINGQGTIGLEMIQQLPTVDAVFIAVGGGGLISGIGGYLKAINPQIKIVACWPENAPAMYRCLKAGRIIDVIEQNTLSDGTAGGIESNAITFPLCQNVIDEYVLVTEQQIRQAIREIAFHERQIIEGAAGVALAAALLRAPQFNGKQIAVVICGRNISLPIFVDILQS